MLKESARRLLRFRAAPAPRKALPGRVPNLNILPPQYQKAELTPHQRSMVQFCAIFFLLAVMLYFTRGDAIGKGVSKTMDKLARREDPMAAQELRLNGQVQAQQAVLRTQRNAVTALQAQQINWSGVIAVLLSTAPPGVSLNTVAQDRRSEVLADVIGRAPEATAVEQYRNALETTPAIVKATITSLRKRPTGGTEFSLSVTVARK